MTTPDSKGLISRIAGIFGGRKTAEAPPGPAAVGLFGKHPAWPDFVHEDPSANMKTGTLARCREPLDTAIRRNIDEGRWDRLKPDQLMPWQCGGDGHTLLWKLGHDWIAGRLWPSVDAVGRAQWPMAALIPVSARIVLADMAQRIDAFSGNLKREVIAAVTQENARAVLKQASGALPQLLSDDFTTPADIPLPPADIGALLADDPLGPQGAIRLLYFMDINFAEFRPAKSRSSSSASTRVGQPAVLRLPAAAHPNTFSLAAAWMRFLLTAVDPRTSILALVPDHQTWIDLSIGPLTPAALFGLKANLAGEPLTTEIPFEIPASFESNANAFLSACRTGQAIGFPTAA